MNFFVQRDRNKQTKHAKTNNRKQGLWQKTLCLLLCIALFGTNMGGISTIAAAAEDTANVLADTENVEKIPEDAAPPDNDIIGWTWTDEKGILRENEGEWYLTLPDMELKDVTEEQLPEMLPKEISVTMTDGTTETLPITWDMSALQEASAANGVCPLTANLPEGYTFQEGTAQPHVVLVQQESKPSDNDIAAWEWVDEEEFLTEYEGEWYLSLPGATAEDLTEELLNGMLPQALAVTLGDGTTETLPVTWDMSVLWEASAANGLYRLNAALPDEYRLKDGVKAPYVLLEYGGAEVYDGKYPGDRRELTNNDNLADHTVKGITPAGTTVNLFDYDPKIGSNGNDVLPAGAKFENYSNGINKDALLLFGGSAMQEAGFWNLGSGAGRPWGQNNVNMKGIVKSTLEDNYPYINLDQARSTLQNPTEPIITEDGPWGNPDRKLMDIAKLNHAEYVGAGVDEARALSVKLLESRGLTLAGDTVSGNCEKASLSYLFDPDTITDGKESYQNVTGLFQVDEDGYYYYDARKNFAEFTKSHATTKDGTQSDGSFTLYDGPAVWRTDAGYNPDTNAFDGDMSLGNFFPFNSASEVFDSIQTADKAGNTTNILSSSETITNVSNAVKANHYMGMTMQVDFTQPENGKLNMGTNGKQPMVFQFSGDDDVWVFIDDVLVLDLGGVHSELYGTIDFSTGQVITGQSWRTGGLPDNPGSVEHDEVTTLYDMYVAALGPAEADAMHWATDSQGNKIFPTGTEHSLKMFYLERGNYDSSLQMRFNLQPSLTHSIKKVDQNGDALEGVEFDLYKATAKNGESVYADDYTVNGDKIGSLVTGKDGKASFSRADGSPFSFTDQHHADGTLHYILKETKTAGGYRLLPNDIVLRFDPENSMLIVANRYQTGAYASFFSDIRETGQLTYGQFNEESGVIASSDIELNEDSKEHGLIVAVPMLLEGNMSHDEVANDGKWQALYGSNTEGYGAVSPTERKAEAWRKAVLKAALYQASDERWPEWRLTYNQNTRKLEGLLEDLPGRSDRYLLNNDQGDMKMVYGVIEPSALQRLGIQGNTSQELYDDLERYVSDAIEAGEKSGKTADEVIEDIVAQLSITGDLGGRDFSFLNTDQFQREFRSTIYIPNERRELRVQKVDQNGKGVNGVEFTLTGPDNSTITGTTATVDGQDGVLIFRPDAPENTLGYAQVKWAEVNSKYTLKETSAPTGYELNPTEIPVIVGIYSIYADAGTKGDGVTVMAGVGKLMQTMTKYAADDMVNITLRDITATAQTQESGKFNLSGWKDDLLAGTQTPRSMNLHYGINAVVDYGLHNEDGGKIIYPFFTTDEGFLRTRVEQNTDALKDELYEGSSNTANWDNLRGRDLTSLFSLLNTVVVTDQKTTPEEETGKLRISKTVYGESLPAEEYTHNFTFKVSLKKPDGTPLDGAYYYYGEQLAGYIKDGKTLPLHHDEAVTILGLPSGTKWEITETQKDGWSVSPQSGVINGTIETDKTSNAAFINYNGTLPTGNLTVSKTVDGNAGDKQKDFHFTVELTNDTVSGTFGNMTFANGVATFTLKHGESKTATGLPLIGYTVTEAEANQDGYTTTASGKKGNIAEGVTQKAIFTNTKTSGGGGGDPGVDPGAGKGNLTISKTVTGNQGDTNKAFNFTVTLSDTSIKGTYGDMTFTDGIATFTLKHGESKTAIDLPPGVRYEVTETEANQDGYTTTASGEKGNIAEGVTQKAIFTNTKNIRPTDPVTPITPDDPTAPTNPTNPEIPTESTEPGTHTDPDTPSVVTDEAVKTGDEANAVLWLMLMGISLIGVICAGQVSKKQGKHSK